MNRASIRSRRFLKHVGIGVPTLAMPVSWTVAGTVKERPNVKVIITDDQGYGDVGFLHRGPLNEGKAIPIRKLALNIGHKIYSAQAECGDTAITIHVDIKNGTKTAIPVFVDKDGQSITAPYYGYVTRI